MNFNMESTPGNNVSPEEVENRRLIKDNIKRVSIFGPSSDGTAPPELLKNIGDKLSELDLTILIGGNKGALKNVSDATVENKGKVIVVASTAGREHGYITENIPGHLHGVYYEDGHSGKKIGLFDESFSTYVKKS